MTKTSSLLFMAGKYRRLADAASTSAARDQRLALAKYFESKAARGKHTAESRVVR